MDKKAIRIYNCLAWDEQVRQHNRWTRPVGPEIIDAARRGIWQVLLTPQIPVPGNWFPDMKGLRILALASGGGQQGPIFAAAGADVVVFDNSGAQLEQDMMVAERENLQMEIIQGDMADLGRFEDKTFNLVFNPVSNCFIPDVLELWQECHRVLKPGGRLLAGFANPVLYMFGDEIHGFEDQLSVKFKIPYSDLECLSQEQLLKGKEKGLPLEFGHSLSDQIGGQLQAGFIISGFYEDRNIPEDCEISKYISTFIATKADRRY